MLGRIRVAMFVGGLLCVVFQNRRIVAFGVLLLSKSWRIHVQEKGIRGHIHNFSNLT